MMLQISISGLFKLFRILVGTFVVLFLLNAAGITFGFLTGHHSLYGLIDTFDFDSQGGVPFYFSSFCLMLAAILLYSIYRSHKNSGAWDSKYWLALAAGFLFLSIDEYVGFHRLLTVPLRSYLELERLFYFAWVIPGMAICGLIIFYFFRFYLHLPRRYKLLFGTAFVMIIGGAIGIEIFNGFYASEDGSANLIYSILYTIEQTLEWTGILLFVYSLLDYLKRDLKTRQIRSMETIRITRSFNTREGGINKRHPAHGMGVHNMASKKSSPAHFPALPRE